MFGIPITLMYVFSNLETISKAHNTNETISVLNLCYFLFMPAKSIYL